MTGDKPVSLELLVDIGIKISDICGREADLVDLQNVSGVILQEIICNGKVILKKYTELYAGLIRKMWYNQSDVMPNVRMIWKIRNNRIKAKYYD